jgi:hypothetical protein
MRGVWAPTLLGLSAALKQFIARAVQGKCLAGQPHAHIKQALMESDYKSHSIANRL